MIGEKYPFFDVPEDDVSPLFTTKLQEAAHVGCLRGVLDGNGTTTDWIRGNDALKSPLLIRNCGIWLKRCGVTDR